jgi:indole-3-glycerol phosphate synthase
VSSSVPSVLASILQTTREALARRKRDVPARELAERALAAAGASVRGGAPGFRAAISQPPLSVIAEFKRRSPSAGELRAGADVAELVGAYERGGARALSVLTEEPSFGGSLADLSAARRASALPVLRKDFTVDPYQLHEALLAGADAVLLIVAALDPGELAELHAQALSLGLDALVEVHDASELEIALQIGAPLVGINNRDLRDFSVDLGRTSLLAADVPAGITTVSESGIARAEQLAALAGDGVDAVLVGESLMRAPDPEDALRALLRDIPAIAGAEKI